MAQPFSAIVWAVLAVLVVVAWRKNWPTHQRRRVLVAALYVLGILFCISGVIGSL